MVASCLHRRALNGSERTVDAAISGERTEQLAAALAVVKELASVNGHRLGLYVTTQRARELGFQCYALVRHAMSMLDRRPACAPALRRAFRRIASVTARRMIVQGSNIL